jgi:hypothetical protein
MLRTLGFACFQQKLEEVLDAAKASKKPPTEYMAKHGMVAPFVHIKLVLCIIFVV